MGEGDQARPGLGSGQVFTLDSGSSPISSGPDFRDTVPMKSNLTSIDTDKLRRQLQRARIANLAAIELGDSKTVARMTCETARLQEAIAFAGALLLPAA